LCVNPAKIEHIKIALIDVLLPYGYFRRQNPK
jgi:hypothetical protein